jgi:hypothetical protein
MNWEDVQIQMPNGELIPVGTIEYSETEGDEAEGIQIEVHDGKRMFIQGLKKAGIKLHYGNSGKRPISYEMNPAWKIPNREEFAAILATITWEEWNEE